MHFLGLTNEPEKNPNKNEYIKIESDNIHRRGKAEHLSCRTTTTKTATATTKATTKTTAIPTTTTKTTATPTITTIITIATATTKNNSETNVVENAL